MKTTAKDRDQKGWSSWRSRGVVFGVDGLRRIWYAGVNAWNLSVYYSKIIAADEESPVILKADRMCNNSLCLTFRTLTTFIILSFFLSFCSAQDDVRTSAKQSCSTSYGETAVMHESILESCKQFVTSDRLEKIQPGSVKRTLECYPTEVFFGDTIYVAEFLENISAAALRGCYERAFLMWEVSDTTFQISSSEIDADGYRWRFENPSGLICSLSAPSRYFSLNPQERFCFRHFYFEICPLEDFDAPFWKELREKLTPKGILCTIQISCNRGEKDDYIASQDILIKPRPDEEMALLEKWYKATPKELLPFQYRGRIPYSGKSDIKFSPDSLKTYDPWAFVRAGFRKPSDPNNPTTLEEWRELEARLTPGTMRDEITLARLRMEYFAAEGSAEEDRVQKNYFEWLDSLPEVQRISMKNYPYVPCERIFRDHDFVRKLRNWKR